MSKVVQIKKLHHICYSTVCGTNVYFRHTFTALENTFANVFFYIAFACTNKRLVKTAITAIAPIVNTVLNMKFALNQNWSKLSKCGLYAIFTIDLLPAKIHFFRPVRDLHLVCALLVVNLGIGGLFVLTCG